MRPPPAVRMATPEPEPEPRAPALVEPPRPEPEPAPRRTARIVQLSSGAADDREKQRQRLLDRLMASETRGAISRAANEYAQAGFEFPMEQAVQLQLLEHFDESQARAAVDALAGLLDKEPPLKRPILEQRLRRLEEYGDEAPTREAAAELRRAIRS